MLLMRIKLNIITYIFLLTPIITHAVPSEREQIVKEMQELRDEVSSLKGEAKQLLLDAESIIGEIKSDEKSKATQQAVAWLLWQDWMKIKPKLTHADTPLAEKRALHDKATNIITFLKVIEPGDANVDQAQTVLESLKAQWVVVNNDEQIP